MFTDHTPKSTKIENNNDDHTRWFYIQHKASNKVIAVNKEEQEPLRSQALVREIEYNDYELWTWDEHYLKNKKTGLVLDIRKGILRLIEDTDICLFHKKPIDNAQNQLWAVKQKQENASIEYQHPLVRPSSNNSISSAGGGGGGGGGSGGLMIHPLGNSDWVLDVDSDERKLILFPYDYNQTLRRQTWEFIPENDISVLAATTSLFQEEAMIDDLSLSAEEYIYSTASLSSRGRPQNMRNSNSSGSISSISTCDSSITSSNGFAHGLTPAKRTSNTPLPLHITNRKRSIAGVF
ncbi:hypothetical protein BDF20DRAFT_832229 [Mycotypha africana]|uniref:uncharacterized protein n=1 Tax=Mycotypha africana TaxID=64632 RepID=UPI0022FFE9A1|nr:uncharacterized protein BDF20DRAFT_832229 [Mycotypha africana]KAI8987278.1 hypothetical protein BDF20DRAFT_832229 [Mycotypha africana]